MPFPPVPPEVKGIAHFLKAAEEHDQRNIVVSYWCRMYACTVAMKIVPGKKPPEVSALLLALMDWLEQTKKANTESDGIINETAAQAIIEEYAINLFNYADAQDRAENFNKNMVKAFYTAGILMDVLQQFGELSEDIFNKRKYAKWKAAYIHNCLKFGDTPIPGPPRENNDDNLIHKSELEDQDSGANPSSSAFDDTLSSRFVPPSQPPLMPNVPGIPPPTQYPSSQPPVTPIVPVTPVAPTTPSLPLTVVDSNVALTPVQIEKAQKYCKWAASALNYDDVKTAVSNLQKGLNLLQTGQDDN